MRRIDFENKQQPKAQAPAPARGRVPHFISVIKAERQVILREVERYAESHLPKNQVDLANKVLALAMRANQILTAFYKGRDLETVESGDLRNMHFLRAATVAQEFMHSGLAENVHVQAFDKWYRENLVKMGYGKYIVDTKKIFFPVL